MLHQRRFANVPRHLPTGLVALLAGLALTACAHVAPTATVAGASSVKAHAVVRAGFADLDNRATSLADLSGHPVVLAFLGPDDRDSNAEIPLLLRLAGGYEADGLVVVGAGENAGLAAYKAFVSDAGITFPFWQDPAGAELAARHFGHVPAFQFITRDGRVQSSLQGFASRGQLTAGAESIVN